MLVQAMVTDPEAHVTHLFIAAPLRARLLAYAERIGAPANVRMRAAEVLQQPHGALPHDDHFHVRIGCPSNMRECVENPSLHLASHGRHHAAGAPLHPRAQSAHPLTARHEAPKRSPRAAAAPAPSHDPYEPLEIEIGADDPDGT
jgi:penicillin-insensitive murein endopeptidase